MRQVKVKPLAGPHNWKRFFSYQTNHLVYALKCKTSKINWQSQVPRAQLCQKPWQEHQHWSIYTSANWFFKFHWSNVQSTSSYQNMPICAEGRLFPKEPNWRSESGRTKTRPFPSSPGPLFQNEGRCSAIDMEIIFILRQIKLIFTRKVVHLASFWKWGFLELGSGLLSFSRPRKLWSWGENGSSTAHHTNLLFSC